MKLSSHLLPTLLSIIIISLNVEANAAFVPSLSSSKKTQHNNAALPVFHAKTTHDSFMMSPNNNNDNTISSKTTKLASILAAAALITITPFTALAATDANLGASAGANAKITTGGASTLQSGRTIAITRGVNLDNSDFSNQNLRGVAFQQSIVRDANFKGSNLVGSSFFDATVDGSNFEGADMTLANIEMAQFNRANLKDAVVREMYVSGATLFEGIKSIENSDWSDTMLRKDQQKYLCNHPTAKGTNPSTGVETRESLMCLD
mmetsp:Transcript_7582/g.10309  ORF Transcript_7582/g.10309 Transcript_7582/m.10309 type:complete len:263 (-) Transcript_7582:283-1071(-)|eukprot:CAMPEP_0185731736 /NCGR_PEP_ID=MMETSP1171-20130828/13883_1 /TAXON_ID=374046 /ORGANISM="Helicotheca tamensis, Strain CCMP826" /LENGTH=262 /DNA_ID=CAMNT_0028401057 /DNA_START=51 /DNA_END=839 /DNA_ORIENTATION=-